MGAVIVLRIVHIGFGVFWAGGVMFMNLLVGPSLGAAGPEGFRVMQELNKRRFMHAILGSAAVTILSGLDLVRRDSSNFSSGWFHSPVGIGISTGMVAAIIAFLIGAFAINPAMKRLGALGAQMMQAAPEARAALMAQVDAAGARLTAFGMVGTVFIVLAVLAMATARYL
jgi:uncharacterized membrane protein